MPYEKLPFKPKLQLRLAGENASAEVLMDVSWLEQTEADVLAENQWLGARESICLDAMRFPKRRTDWRLGRWTAKQAVAACLNLPTDIRTLADIEVLAAPSGAPEVFLRHRPAQIAISLSHREGTALCTVAPAGTSFGCDLETIEPHSNAFIEDYCTSEEQALIARTPVEDRALIVSLVWSAKESSLKALQQGLRLDTRCVCVWLVDGLPRDTKERHEFCLGPRASNPDGWHALRIQCSSGPAYGGWWRCQDRFVRTIVSNLALEIPTRAREESGLTETPPSSLDQQTV